MLHTFLGVRKKLMSAVPLDVMDRQFKIYKWLFIMVLVITFLTSFAFYIYGVVIFHSIIIALVCSIFFGYVVYNLFNLLLLSSLNPMNQSIYRIWVDKKDKDFAFKDLNDEKIAGLQTEAEINGYLFDIISSLRKESEVFKPRKESFLNKFIKNLFLITVMLLLAIIVANAIELFIYRAQINSAISNMLKSKVFELDPWIKKIIFTPEHGKQFILIHSNSLLLDLELLIRGLGKWKIVIDFLIILIFVFPFVLMHRSSEFLKGEYIRELSLFELKISTKHYILSKHKINEIKEFIESTGDKEKLFERLYGFPKPDKNRIVI